jgi:hypothetical protein
MSLYLFNIHITKHLLKFNRSHPHPLTVNKTLIKITICVEVCHQPTEQRLYDKLLSLFYTVDQKQSGSHCSESWHPPPPPIYYDKSEKIMIPVTQYADTRWKFLATVTTVLRHVRSLGCHTHSTASASLTLKAGSFSAQSAHRLDCSGTEWVDVPLPLPCPEGAS